MQSFTEQEVLEELDKAFKDSDPLGSKPEGSPYDFFLDLEPPYTIVGGSKIYLYADSVNWAVVFETNGYNTRGGLPNIELSYVGNCINFDYKDPWGNPQQSNTFYVELMTPEEIERIRNKKGRDYEQFEKVAKDINSIYLRNTEIFFKNDYKEFEKLNIQIQDFENPNNLIDYGSLFRYLSEVNPEAISVNETEIREHLNINIPPVITITNFHYTPRYRTINDELFSEKKDQIFREKSYNSVLDKSLLPSQQELFQLIAKILVTKDTTLWRPSLPANNHWSNWESGAL